MVARSFARIFFRNAINTGLSICVCPEAVDATEMGDEVETRPGRVRNLTKDLVFDAEPLPHFVLDIVRAGGLVEAVRQRMSARPS